MRTHARCHHARRFSSVVTTHGTNREDLTCQFFTTGRGPQACICYGKMYSEHALVPGFSDLLVWCAVSARTTARDTQSRGTTELHEFL